MRRSRILKIICYILIPILVLILGISIFYEACKENYLNSTMDDKMYFQSDDFVYSYMSALSKETYNLIYNNANYKNVEDNNYIIYYNESLDQYGLQIEDYFYLIIYRNKAYTNVELTANTNTLESIKEFIKNNSKYATIINGNVSSNSEIISNKAIKYFNLFENTYYTKEKYVDDDSVYDILNYDEETSRIYNIYTEKIDDLQIYSSYNEKVIESDYSIFYKEILTYLNKYENIFVVAIPVTATLLVLIAVFLVISIGYTKESNGIELNDLDKIPFEIVTAVAFGIVIALIFLAGSLSNIINPENMLGFISLYIAMYCMGYVLCATWGITFVKRIKSKTLLKTSIIVIMIKFILKQISRFFKWIKKVIKNAYSKIKGKIPLYLKVIGGMIGYCFIVVILTMLFGSVGLIFAGIIAFVLIYPLIVNINCFSKVEKHLEKMYKGEYAEKLKSEEFTSDFQNTVTYINDISSGFEKAIDENVKSERLKTELITNVSHDIKTPLTSIINYVDLLKKEDIENEKVKEYLDILENKSQRLKKLTEDLVEASKASSGNVKLNLEKINICELIRQATGEFEDKFGEKKLEIISSFPDQDLYINADNRYLYRVIENLYSNISKYTLESSRVYIDIKRIENNVNVTMKNISKEKLNISAEELAQRFVRGDKSRSTEGSGLGISISKSLTELQNGKFSLQIDGDLFKVELEFAII